MLLPIVSLLGLTTSVYAFYRLQWVLLARWTALLGNIGAQLSDDDPAQAQALCAVVPDNIMSQLARAGLALLEGAPEENLAPYFAAGLAPMMVRQRQRVRRLGLLALLGVLPTMALALGVQYPPGWQYVAFGALVVAIVTAARAHLVRTQVIPRMVAALIELLSR